MPQIIIAARAQKQLAAAARWWLRHRDKAPEAFEEDVAHAYATIAASPTIGTPVRSRRGGMRRLPLPRIRYYIYYRAVRDDVIEVAAIWHFSRRPPRL